MKSISSDERFLLKEKYNGIESPEFFEDLNRLALGEPVAYVIGWIPFLGCKIFLDSRPLIPRPETEYWVEQAITKIKNTMIYHSAASVRVLDLFAGSGAIGVAVLKHLPNTRVDFGEIETRHFSTINKNLKGNGILPGRARIIETDVFGGITDSYDFILANPPYISESRQERVQQSVLAHEPKEALFAKDEGFALISKTLSGIPDHLVSGGQCYIEHELEHAERIQKLAKELNLVAETLPDQYGILRYSRITHLS